VFGKTACRFMPELSQGSGVTRKFQRNFQHDHSGNPTCLSMELQAKIS